MEVTRSIGDLVVSDLKDHIENREAHHGGPLLPNRGPDKLGELYEQLMDACLYVRCYIEEQGNG